MKGIVLLAISANLFLCAPLLAQSCAPFQELKRLENEYKSLKYDILPQERGVIERCTYAKKLQEIDNRQASYARQMIAHCSNSLMFRDDVSGAVGHTRELMAKSIVRSRLENQQRVQLECKHVAEVERALAEEKAPRLRRPKGPSGSCGPALAYVQQLKDSGQDTSNMERSLAAQGCQ